jgi:hypothetical protein
MDTLKLDGGDGQTYGGQATSSRDTVSHAAWTHDFFGGPATKERSVPSSINTDFRRFPWFGRIGQRSRNRSMCVLLQTDSRLPSRSWYFPFNTVITAETPVRLSASLLVNRDPLDLGGEVTHLFALPASHSLQSSLATITLHTDEFGERTSHIALWNVCKSTSALHATFSQLTTVSNIPAPKDEAVVTQRGQVLIVVLDIA